MKLIAGNRSYVGDQLSADTTRDTTPTEWCHNPFVRRLSALALNLRALVTVPLVAATGASGVDFSKSSIILSSDAVGSVRSGETQRVEQKALTMLIGESVENQSRGQIKNCP